MNMDNFSDIRAHCYTIAKKVYSGLEIRKTRLYGSLFVLSWFETEFVFVVLYSKRGYGVTDAQIGLMRDAMISHGFSMSSEVRYSKYLWQGKFQN